MYVEAYESSSSYHKTQLYNAIVISDFCNRSLSVIPFKTEFRLFHSFWLALNWYTERIFQAINV